MILYKLIAITLSVTTGDVIDTQEIGDTKPLEECIKDQIAKGPQHPIEGVITVFECKPVEIV